MVSLADGALQNPYDSTSPSLLLEISNEISPGRREESCPNEYVAIFIVLVPTFWFLFLGFVYIGRRNSEIAAAIRDTCWGWRVVCTVESKGVSPRQPLGHFRVGLP